MFLEISQKSQENSCARVSLLGKLQTEACNFLSKETLAEMFSCEFCEISYNTFFTEHLWATASQLGNKMILVEHYDDPGLSYEKTAKIIVSMFRNPSNIYDGSFFLNTLVA